jgi:hypothetical protein
MISADLPFSVWLPLMADNDLPDDAALIEVRITDNGKPVPVAYDNGKVDESATLYIKSCGNLQLFIHWLVACLRDSTIQPMHPAAKIYHSTADSHLLWPLDGLQFRYVTESQLRESTC